MDTNTTSPFRQAAFHAITLTVMRVRGDLIDRFAELTAESRSDDELLEFARDIGVPNIDDWIGHDRTRVELTVRHLCNACDDLGQVEQNDGRWARCPNCNPASTAHLVPFQADR